MFSSKEQPAITLRKDSEWRLIERRICRVINFNPMGAIQNGRVSAIDKSTPYAMVNLECEKLPGKNISGFITHKIDFINLWQAFMERGIKQNEEVIIVWTISDYKNTLIKLFSFMMPKLLVWICQKGAFELMIDSNWKPEISGMKRSEAMRPIIELKPDVMNGLY